MSPITSPSDSEPCCILNFISYVYFTFQLDKRGSIRMKRAGPIMAFAMYLHSMCYLKYEELTL